MTRVALAGGDGAATLLSHLAAEHSHGRGLLGFFDTLEAGALRLVCREFLGAITAFPFHCAKLPIPGSLALWRASFPRARAACIAVRDDLVDADFAHLRGVHTVNLRDVSGLSDAAFAHLEGVRTLLTFDVHGFSPDAMRHVRGARELVLKCSDALVKGLHFVAGVERLEFLDADFSDDFFASPSFSQLRELSMTCSRRLTDKVFEAIGRLPALRKLSMRACWQETITDAAFAHLRGIEELDMLACNQCVLERAKGGARALRLNRHLSTGPPAGTRFRTRPLRRSRAGASACSTCRAARSALSRPRSQCT
jgi:hypothetical protein